MTTDTEVVTCPDWAMIDEISIPLLETGVGTLPVLQAALPSILAMDLQDEKVEERFRKIIRIAQLQIQHLLRSQQDLLKHMENMAMTRKQIEKKITERKMSLQQDYTKFKCDDCGKLFVNDQYLTSHFERRHPQLHSTRHSSSD